MRLGVAIEGEREGETERERRGEGSYAPRESPLGLVETLEALLLRSREKEGAGERGRVAQGRKEKSGVT